MTLWTEISKPFSSFRARLLGIVSLGILSLALTASITAALVTGHRAADQMVAQGLRIVETLSEQSVLALLYESEANAEKPLDAILSFPDIEHAGVYYRDYSALLTTGENQLPIPDQLKQNSITETTMIDDTNLAWHFIAPVVVIQQEDLFPDLALTTHGEADTEVLGYAYVVMNKSTLRELQLNMILNNIVIALSFAIILSILVNYGINKMIQPLYKLVRVMEKNEKEQTREPVELNGPKEVTHLANVFNRMMGSLDERDRRLREHGEELESLVEIRTRELVAARDAALIASRHKSEFLANMSHELRTPLQAIIGYADVVKEELELDGFDEQADGLSPIIRNGTRLLALINNILDLSKIESGKMDLKLEPVNLKNLLQDAADTIRPILRQNNNSFTSEHQADNDSLIIDRDKLLQMVLNLLGNAAKFTRNGQVKLISDLRKNHLLVKVEDTGIGLSEEEQSYIFEEFRQVDGSTTRNFEGTGLGLSITKKFAERMGGKILVESVQGNGATFSIFIPLPIEVEEELITPVQNETQECLNA